LEYLHAGGVSHLRSLLGLHVFPRPGFAYRSLDMRN
jgi:hypothetical protein